MKKSRRALLTSALSLLLCFSMLLGTTWAWFTDSVTSTNNIIKSGNLDVELYYQAEGQSDWTKVTSTTNIFMENALWEPGHTEVVKLKVVNEGSLALKYLLDVNVASEVGSRNVKGEDFKLSEYIYFGIVNGEQNYTREQAVAAVETTATKLNTPYNGTETKLLAKNDSNTDETVVTMVVYMPTWVTNEANHAKDAPVPTINLGINLYATQVVEESDSFGDDYDTDAEWPGLGLEENATGSAAVTSTDGKVDAAATINTNTEITATVPAGVAVDSNTLTLTVTEKDTTDSGLTTGTNEELMALDVHVEGVSENNTTPLIISLGKVLPVGMNLGNVSLYHVEGGATNVMTQVDTLAEVDAHNEFYYDPATGEVTVAMATFSEVTVVADETKAWEGNFDYSWYTNAVAPVDSESVTEYVIANADQLAAFGAIVGGMDGQTQDSFSGKTVKLIADVNLGDKESENNPDIIFYPIGYNSDDGKYEKTGVAVSTGFYSFMGTFDGNGHTIANFYQNTWEMKGDHNWYDATLQYYRDGMGLFGKVYGGTVKNLTVANFSSDGEIATTGVIAAYADGATFENIAIFDCNPRVYNIGNGGIVGCVGWYAKEAGLKTTFTNITVDNSNKISALWGSYDVACGGIVGQYYPTSGQTSAGTPKNAGIHFENCHVSAQMDVYNDVCANYQYYAYRYTGMLIGSVRENETIDGHIYPKMDGITASGCTVHFGDWNDYYYCELVANTTASYTHDHQMSRLEQVASVDVENKTVTSLKGETTAIPSSGRVNYVVVKAKDANGMWIHGDGHNYAECYHFVNGVQHKHDIADNDNPNVYETVNGVEVLKEDKQLIYREFNQLFTGYGWGVTSKGLTDFEGVTNMDITEGKYDESVVKFEGKEVDLSKLAAGDTVNISSLFSVKENVDPSVKYENVMVSVTDLTNTGITADFIRGESWDKGTLKFNGTNGVVKITIQDYYFCTPTSITVEIGDFKTTNRFAVAFPSTAYNNRVGNEGTVALGKLFTAADGIGDNVTVEFETVIGASVDKTEIKATKDTWANQTVQFSNTGIVKVTISDDNFSTPVTQYLEVVDAVNATSATNATANNVVLLNDISSGFTVSGDHTFFGNGFALNYTGNGQYLNNGLRQGIVTVSENGTLDNLRIKATIYPASYLYYEEAQAGPSSVEGDKTRYHYQLSAVVTKGNATISNCYIYGARTNIFVDTGDVTIKDTILECGTLANVQIQSTSASTVTFENVTTIQYQVNPTIDDTSLVMLGAGVIVGPDTDTNPTIVLNGSFKQYNWVNADDKEAVSNSTAKSIIETAVGATAFNHTINGETASNLGIIYLNDAYATVTNNTGLPYAFGDVNMMSQNGKVYSLQNATESQIYSDYENADRTTVNGDYMPTFDFGLGDQEISYDGSEDTRYLYGDANGVTALYQDGDDALTLDLSKLATIYKYTDINYTVTASCKDASGNALTATNNVVTLSEQGDYTLEFTVDDNIFYNNKGEAITKSVTRTYTVPLTLTVKEANVKNAEISITKTALDGVYTTVNLTDYKLRINFLDCISVTDYGNAGTGTTVDLTSNISSATLTPSGVNVFTTASTATITYTDGRVLTVNLSKISGSSAGTKTATVNTSGGVYFITDGALDNKPTESSSQNTCTITSVSFKGNSGSTVTNDTDVMVTWALDSSSSGDCVTPDTLVTLADGSQVRVDSLIGSEELLVWDFYNGAYTVVPAALIVNHGYGDWTVIELNFEDGTTVKAISSHAFFDADTNEWALINAGNVQDYVGHSFVQRDGDSYKTVKMVSCNVYMEYTESYSLVSALHYNFITENMFSLTKSVYGMISGLEVGEDMTYELINDIEQYGLYTYADFADYITYEQYVAFNGDYLRISVEKGYITFDEILALIEEYL